MKSYRILICGAGSVGERHLRNLTTLGQSQVALLRQKKRPLRTIKDKIPQYTDWGNALAEFKPEVVIVTNPTSLHLPTALRAAKAGCHVLVEKPVSDKLAGLEQLAKILKSNKRYGMVAYMLRFHPLLRQIKAWLAEGEKGRIGLPIYAQMFWAEHVPDWHPWEDYAESYAVQKKLGGGAALTYSHDLDLCLWLLGVPQKVAGWPGSTAKLAGDAEHGFDLLLSYRQGFTAHIHADYFTRPPVRRWELTGTRGRVVFDYYAGTLTRYDGIVGERPTALGSRKLVAETLKVPAGFDRNDMFLDELRYFFDCLDRGVPPQPDIRAGAQAVQLALAARAAKVRQFPANPFSPLS